MASKLRAAIDLIDENGLDHLVEQTSAYVRREANRRYSALRYEPTAPRCRVMDEDWANLVILDACRYDQFERTAGLRGRLEARISLASCAPEFLASNFEDGSHYDAVYAPRIRCTGPGSSAACSTTSSASGSPTG